MSRRVNTQPAPGQRVADMADWTPAREGRCVCGNRVDSDVARVCGVDAVVPACGWCWETYQTDAYTTVTSAVKHWLDGNGSRVAQAEIDPTLHPEVDG